MRRIILFILVTLSVHAKSAVISDSLMNWADRCPSSIELNHHHISNYLASACTSDEEKVLIFSYWIARNIQFDLHEMRKISRSDKTAYEVLRNKKAVCEGFANLLKQFCDNEGIRCYKITGWAYGNIVRRLVNTAHMRHAWNVVYLDGKWVQLDVTWARHEIAEKEFKQNHSFKWIFPDPEEFTKSHWPREYRWQLLRDPWSKREFWSQKKTDPSFYAVEDSLEVLLHRKSYENDLILARCEYEIDNDHPYYLNHLYKLGWDYVGGNYDSTRISEGIIIFNYLSKELNQPDFNLRKPIYASRADQGIRTAEWRLQHGE